MEYPNETFFGALKFSFNLPTINHDQVVCLGVPILVNLTESLIPPSLEVDHICRLISMNKLKDFNLTVPRKVPKFSQFEYVT